MQADPDPKADDYFTGAVSGALTEEQGNVFSAAFIGAFLGEQPDNASLTMEMIFDVVKDVSGGAPITRREALIAFAAWKLSDVVADMNSNPLAALLAGLGK